MAYTAGLHPHDDVIGAGLGNDDIYGLNFRALRAGNNSFYSHVHNHTYIFNMAAVMKMVARKLQ